MSVVRFSVPPGATDTHMHFYDAAVQAAADAHNPGSATVAQYRTLQQRLGLERVIVVQPNAYRDDNRVTLKAVAEMGPGARAVCVVGEDASDAELERLTRAGAVAQRFFQLEGGAVRFERMAPIMARVHPFGWHANLQLDGAELPRWEAAFRNLPGRFVIDHIARFPGALAADHAAVKSLLRLLDTGRCWMKLSAPYILSRADAPRYRDLVPLARLLVQHAPERMLWASNWPHPSEPRDAMPDDAGLLGLLADWAPDEATRQRILVNNPAELYGF
jgi:D-galactarolactone isomerase